MPRLPSTVSPTRNSISNERRERIVALRLNKRQSYSKIAKDESLPLSTVSSIVSRFQKSNCLLKKQRGGVKRQSKLQQEHINHVQQFWRRWPLSTLKDARNNLMGHFPGLTLSVSTLQRAISSKGTFTLKRVHRDLPARNSTSTKRKRQAWCAEWLPVIDRDKAVYIDESGFNLATARQYGWSEEGSRAIATRPSQGANLTLILAVSVEQQVIAHQERFGSTDASVFLTFIKETLLPALEGPHQIVMDNAAFHKSSAIREALQNAGHTIIFQPPYTPEFNLCEWCFGLIKGYVGKQDIDSHGSLLEHLSHKLSSITPSQMQGFLAESIRWTKVAQFGKDLGIQHNAAALEEREMEDWSENEESESIAHQDTQHSSLSAISEDPMSLA